ncbi:2-oxo-4-hydroxy-4-carboxy-5-ureidoimidazoline decarboxylase [Thalassotalea euphylliae]|uniref:2-oxo-4-hydroxy-4-carboxy-5-ureidoimidazoline decarboxylase n=1 Tax=Thalassotalea euphylliae TaxID=1655234 RepID=A0A3E0UGR8_9GAMM|nr:2-oxo-4-hydroxy-4-carboxy-5-ureidoimidazoline decarboxylase [Thalassotalea euphylliae]REL36198.1 2-oxo-4-hydroxy-4-carboxy-5-ureidoimidazoline decarboxylase [Thalassotalea euphylliae]
MTVEQFNLLDDAQAHAALQSCCVAPRWIDQMLLARPFVSREQLLFQAQQTWQLLGESDYLAAFEGHPQIGDVSTLSKKFANTAKLAGHEQSGMSQADEQVLEEMLALNQAYLAKFGFIFIVCATGKSALEMLELIRERINNEPATELAIAAAEQAKITKIRLEKLV